MIKKRFFKTLDEVELTFEFDANGAEEVALVSEISDWQPVEMKKYRGVWRAKLRAPKNGEFQFRYLIDGSTWANDEAADAYVANNVTGDDNSVVKTYE